MALRDSIVVCTWHLLHDVQVYLDSWCWHTWPVGRTDRGRGRHRRQSGQVGIQVGIS